MAAREADTLDVDLAPVLILDNLGAEPPSSEWYPARLFELIDGRARSGDPIVCTSRFDPDALAAHYGSVGPDIVSRLTAGRVVGIGGKDRRGGR